MAFPSSSLLACPGFIHVQDLQGALPRKGPDDLCDPVGISLKHESVILEPASRDLGASMLKENMAILEMAVPEGIAFE